VAAGLAMFLAALDAIEPLAQEVDHPTRRDASPFERGHIHIRHVPVGVVVLILASAIAVAVAAAPGTGHLPAAVAGVLVVPLALGGVGGALVSTLSGPPTVSDAWTLAPPEAQGMRLVVRTAWPPVVAVIGALPALAARAAERNGDVASAAALSATVGVVLLFVLICGWVRMRDRIAEWWRGQMDAAYAQNRSGTDA
jgi:hypothetical protein